MSLDTRLYTWLDVESVIQKQRRRNKWPDEIKNIQVFADGIDVFLQSNEEEKVKKAFNLWFGDWYDASKNLVYLESLNNKSKALPVITIQEEFKNSLDSYRETVRPFFGDLALFTEFEENQIDGRPAEFPPPVKSGPKMLAFYSFKGGVGRTLQVVAALKSILESDQHSMPRVLLVDADIEAPGLTWWAREKGELPELSILDFLALANYDETEFKDTIKLTARTLNETFLTVDKHKMFFLPAFRNLDQLLRVPIRPEHLVRNPGQNWVVGDLLFQLGKELKVDYVLVDLRAGLSELAAPLLFDPRIIRFLITTYSDQSVDGMKLILKQLAKVVPANDNEQGEYYDPYLIFSMVPEELKETEEFTAIQQNLIGLYPDSGEDDATPARLITSTTYFAQQLLYLESLEQAWHKLSGTSVYTEINRVLSILLPKEQDTNKTKKEISTIKNSLTTLTQIADDLEYAESGKSVGYLPVPAIRNLGQKFSVKMPVSVVIGSKGSGKTYMYLQLTRLGTWKGFLENLDVSQVDKKGKSQPMEIFPLLESSNLLDEAKELTSRRRDKVWEKVNRPKSWEQSKLRDKIHMYLKGDVGWDHINWREYWFHLIGLSLGMEPNSETEFISIEKIQAFLRKRRTKVIVLIDGLEDIFTKVKTNQYQSLALKGLLDIPEVLREFRESYLGVICFIRRDLIRAVIKQNLGQYEYRYSPFDLTWDFEEALRLVLWIWYRTGERFGFRPGLAPKMGMQELLLLDRDKLAEYLIPFWGRKLGAPHSKEAITANWILAALSDFQGQLQARDLVRLIKHAAIESQKNIVYQDRLLQPAAIRKAIQPCSSTKIFEIQQEFEVIEPIFDKLRESREDERKIPFDAGKFNLSAQEIEQLVTLGVVQKVDEKYYMPEIFRYGLGFTLDRGARPTVLALKKKFLPIT